MDDFNWIALLVAVLGGGGIGVAIREIAAVVTLARQGVSGREDRRKADIVAARDAALAAADKAERERDEADAFFENERRKRRIAEDELVLARRALMEAGIDPRPWPDENTDRPT